MQALVDDEDYDRLVVRKWQARPHRKTVHAIASMSNPKRTIQMHRVVLNAPKGTIIDHKNGNGLDNRK
jgi:hypothetical protein